MPNDDRINGKSKRGYRPTNVGYSAEPQDRNATNAQSGRLPKAPKSGSGERAEPSAPTGSAKVKQ